MQTVPGTHVLKLAAFRLRSVERASHARPLKSERAHDTLLDLLVVAQSAIDHARDGSATYAEQDTDELCGSLSTLLRAEAAADGYPSVLVELAEAYGHAMMASGMMVWGRGE